MQRSEAAGETEGEGKPVVSGAQPAQYVPDQLIVKYRDSVVEPVDRLLARRGSFHAATTDGSDSLDRLHAKFGVRSARPVFELLEPSEIPDRASHATMKQLVAEKLKEARRRFPKRAARATSQSLPDLSHIYALDLPPGIDVTKAAREFGADEHIEYAQPNYVVTTQLVPNDPYYPTSGSWGQPYQDLWGLWQIQAGSAWDVTQGEGVVVAVVDTGLDMSHPDITANVWSNPGEVVNGVDDDGDGKVDDYHGWDFVERDNDPSDAHGHGTHVSGTIAAVGNNGVGVVGVAPHAKVMPVRALDAGGFGWTEDLAAAIEYAAEKGADVINNSWGCTSACPSNPVVEDAVRVAHGLGAVVVFAAGNSSRDVANFSPQNMGEPITVTASTNIDTLAWFSNFGAGVDVAAPGAGAAPPQDPMERGILSLQSNPCNRGALCPDNLLVGNGYLRQAGTSMAAPHVAGVAALVLSAHPTFKVEQVRQAIRHGSDDIAPTGFDDRFGYGRLNAARAIAEDNPLEALITSPSSPLTGFESSVVVHAIAAGPGFSSYTIAVGQGGMPASWTTIATSTTPVSPVGPVASLDLTALGDGIHTLRLSARNTGGQIYEDRQTVTIDRVALVDPPAGDTPTVLRGGGVIPIVGTVFPSDFVSYRIEVYDRAANVWLSNPNITLTDGGAHKVANGVLATWNTVDLPAGSYVIRLWVTLTSGGAVNEDAAVVVDPTLHPGWPKKLDFPYLTSEHHLVVADVNHDGRTDVIVGHGPSVVILDHTGASLPGWPQSIDPAGVGDILRWDDVSIGDLTGDGDPEVVAGTFGGTIFVWSSAGVLLPGWPVSGYPKARVSIADVDGSGASEIVVTDWSGTVTVLSASAAPFRGWPRMLPGSAGWNPLSPPVVGDLDGDGTKEIAVVRFMGPNDLYVLSSTGAILPGWPRAIGPTLGTDQEFYRLNPAMGELDSDLFREIVVCGYDGVVHVLNHDGSEAPGWPQATPAMDGTCSYAAIGDLDGDGGSEIVLGFREGSTNVLSAWHRDGTILPGWPVRYEPALNEPRGVGFSTASIADLDGDGAPDVTASRDGLFSMNAYAPDGLALPGFPKPTATVHLMNANSSPAVADLDGDGLLELAWIDGSSNLYVWDLPGPSSGPQPWPMFHHDAQRTGANIPVGGAPQLQYDGYTALTQVDGNGNAWLEPGESWELRVSLRNDGVSPAGGVSANLTVDPAAAGSVFLLQDHADYGTIDPGQVVPSLQAYRFRIGDAFPCGGRVVLSVSGITSTPSRPHPDQVGVIRVPVGQDNATSLYSDGFEPRPWGFPFFQTEGEWQADLPRGLGGPQADPASAYQGQYVLGTDLTGLGANPGNYENGVASSAYSPVISLGGVPTGIRFAHWINLAAGDYLTMRVSSNVSGDQTTFFWAPRSESSWTIETFDISDMAPGKSSIQVQFLLQSDAQSTGSGWNMDAFEVLGGACQPFQRTLPGEAANLRVSKGSPNQLRLDWSADCGGATTYAIYHGDLRVGYSSLVAEPGFCDVTGTTATILLGSGNAEFFLVVPHKEGEEGSYGQSYQYSSAASRPSAAAACYPQGAFAVCAP